MLPNIYQGKELDCLLKMLFRSHFTLSKSWKVQYLQINCTFVFCIYWKWIRTFDVFTYLKLLMSCNKQCSQKIHYNIIWYFVKSSWYLVGFWIKKTSPNKFSFLITWSDCIACLKFLCVSPIITVALWGVGTRI